MTTEPLRSPEMIARLAERRAALGRPAPGPVRLRRAGHGHGSRGMSGPLVLAIESSCDETGIALVEGGRRILANVVASQVALHAATGGIVPEVAARAHLRWIVPVLDTAWAGCRRRLVRHRRRRGDLRARAGRLAARRPELREGARLGPPAGRWSGSTTSTGTSRPPGCSTRPRPSAPSPSSRSSPWSSPAATRSSPRCATTVTTGSSARPSTTPPARRSTRSAGCSGCGYPGGPAIMRAAAEATSRDVVFPRAWLGDTYDFSFSGLKTAARRIIDAARAEAGLPPGEPGAAPAIDLPPAVVAELAWGFQDAVDRRPRPQDGPGGPGDRRPLDRRRRRGRGEPGPGRAAGRRGRGARAAAPRAAARPVHRQRGDDRGRRRPPATSPAPGPASTSTPGPTCPWRRGDASRAHPASIRPGSARRCAPPGSTRAIRSARTSSSTSTSSRTSSPQPRPRPVAGVLEIGPGLGFLTAALLEAGAAVSAVELDPGLAAFLRDRFGAALAGSGPGLAPAHRGRRARPAARPACCPSRTTSSPTCPTTSPARSSTGCSASRPVRAGSC